MLSEPLFLEVHEPPPNMQNRIPRPARVLPLYRWERAFRSRRAFGGAGGARAAHPERGGTGSECTRGSRGGRSKVFAVKSLPQAVDWMNSPESFPPIEVDTKQMLAEASQYPVDLRDVRGQAAAKRALEVACAGSHNILLIGGIQL